MQRFGFMAVRVPIQLLEGIQTVDGTMNLICKERLAGLPTFGKAVCRDRLGIKIVIYPGEKWRLTGFTQVIQENGKATPATSSTAVRRSPFPSRGRLMRFLRKISGGTGAYR